MRTLLILSIFLVSASVMTLATYRPWSGLFPTHFEDRHDAKEIEAMAGLGEEYISATQAHRVFVPFLLKLIPGEPQARWALLLEASLLIVLISWWYIGLRIGARWEAGVIAAAIALAVIGWQFGMLPWHIDVPVAAIESIVLALFIWRRWAWMPVVLVIGVLTKETFLFLAFGLWLAAVLEVYFETRRNGNTDSVGRRVWIEF